MIWLQSLPTTATVEFNEAEFDVTSISPHTPLLLTSKEAHAAAKASFSSENYPIWGPEDWEMLSLDGEKMILQIIIHPSNSASLSITWADIWGVLGDALLAAKQLHIVCRQPERLARLFMLEEAEWLGVGQACNEAGLFTNDESVSGERKTRESLQTRLSVTASRYTVEELDEGGRMLRDDVSAWKLVEERITARFGPKADWSSTEAFSRVEADVDSVSTVWQLHSAAKALEVPSQVIEEGGEGNEEADEMESSGMELTEDAVAKHLEECRMIWPPEPKDPSWDEEGSISYPDNDAVIKWLA